MLYGCPVSPDRLRMLVLSDLHAYEGGATDGSPSLLAFGAGGQAAAGVFDDCLRALREAGINDVDLVLCAGDITDRADPEGLRQAWAQLVRVATALNGRLVATSGNHDYDSRSRLGVSPKASLLALEPTFPALDNELQRDYFAFDFAHLASDRYEIVTLNSAAQHGYVIDDEAEFNHGRVVPETVARIEKHMRSLPSRPYHRVLLTHHHLVQLPLFDLAETSQMRDSHRLLRALDEDGPWFVVHGHKHRPWLQYGPGGGGAPILFSAGSFSVNLGGGVFGGATRNQFYVVDLLDREESAGLDLDLAGNFSAWSYNGRHWARSGPNDGLPGQGGFGWRISPSRVAAWIGEAVEKAGGVMTWAQLVEEQPRLPYVLPDDLESVNRILAASMPVVEVARNEFGCPTEFTQLHKTGTQ